MMSQLDRLILVTGTARAGKTLITGVLRTSPEFAHFAEPMHIWSVIPPGRDHDRLDRSDATPETARGLIDRCAKAVAAQGRSGYLDDYAYHALAAPFIHAVFPSAKIIHVIRDPVDIMPQLCWGWTNRDSVAKAIFRRRGTITLRSLHQYAIRFARNYFRSRLAGRRESYGPRVPGMKEFAPGRSVAEVAAYQWKQMVEIARNDLAGLPEENRLEVRFENLILDTENEYRRIAAFAGVEDVDAIVGYAKTFVEPGRTVTTRIEPTVEEWERIWELIGDLADELGYEPRFRTRVSSAAGEDL